LLAFCVGPDLAKSSKVAKCSKLAKCSKMPKVVRLPNVVSWPNVIRWLARLLLCFCCFALLRVGLFPTAAQAKQPNLTCHILSSRLFL